MGQEAMRQTDPPDGAELAHEWFRDFLTQPHDQLGRAGAVCPFVEPSLKVGSLHVEEWPVAEHPDVDAIVAVIERMVRRFGEIAWAGKNATLHALAVVLPDLTAEQSHVLDDAQRLAKADVVRRGLMVGQFHSVCKDRAVRNPDFEVSQSPVPILVVRNLAFHDILFLDSTPEWFALYAARYGHRYERPSAIDPLFATRYAQARARWSRGR